MAPGRRVLRRVFQQIDQHAFNQQGVEAHQRQVARQPHFESMLFKHMSRGVERGSHHLFQRLPLQVQPHFAALDASHIEQIADEGAHASRFVLDGFRGFRLRRRQGRLGHCQRFRQAHEHGQRGSQVMGQRGQQRIAQSLRLHAHQSILSDSNVVDPLERDGDQRGEGIQKLPLLRYLEQPPILRTQCQHPARLGRSTQRNV